MSYGEHNAILQLVALREDLEQFRAGALESLYWHRSYHLRRPAVEVISLAEWLKTEGHEPNLDE